jgi:hypothetical protein
VFRNIYYRADEREQQDRKKERLEKIFKDVPVDRTHHNRTKVLLNPLTGILNSFPGIFFVQIHAEPLAADK